MKYSNRPCRGQVSIENLILYGSIIVVVIVGLVIIWQSGILNPNVGRKGYIGFSQIVPVDWVVGVRGASYLSIKNSGNAPLKINAKGIKAEIGRVSCNPVPESDNVTRPGQVLIFKLICPGPPTMGEEYRIGDYYEVDVSIDYTNVISNRRHTSVGKLYGLMEDVDPDAPPPTAPTSSSTTDTTIPYCFNHQCNKPGQMDEENCGEIPFITGPQECMYCPKRLDLDGRRKCYYNGQCGTTCSVDKDCDDTNPEYGHLNLCDKCVNGRCDESPDNPVCGPCPPADAGTFGSLWCDNEDCPYCEHVWVQTGPHEGDGYDSYTCELGEDCGQSCVTYSFDIYDECEENCVHCEPLPEDPSQGTCEQGDCGRRCGPGAPIEECEIGCLWCNTTGPNPSYKCELGDCGRPCTTGSECTLGCEQCWNGRCVKAEIEVNIVVNNGTQGGDIVKEDKPIYVNVTAASEDGIQRLIVSNSLAFPFGMGVESCDEVANERNSRSGEIVDPLDETGGRDAETQDWMDDWGISWYSQYDCSQRQSCANTWVTSESNVNIYCYFALAQKVDASTGGPGRWSMIVADDIQVGYIDVFLAFPPPS